MRTSANQVRSIVRALLARFVSAKKVGIITHSCHVAAINQLDDFWKKRIAKIEYFHSGKDRASNNWLDCDLILVLGTPRVSPAVVREHLITVGEIESAKFNKRFDKLYWEGKNESGEIVTVQGRGYYDEYWCEANNHFVKETLVQAIGRGRSVTEKGVDVVVVSNENLGMVLADSPLQPLSEQVDGTLHHILRKRLAARNAIYYTIGDVAANFTSDVIATISGKPIRTITSHFSQLITHGLVMRQGERSGYRLADWLLAYFVK
jgi:hypothetical protein